MIWRHVGRSLVGALTVFLRQASIIMLDLQIELFCLVCSIAPSLHPDAEENALSPRGCETTSSWSLVPAASPIPPPARRRPAAIFLLSHHKVRHCKSCTSDPGLERCGMGALAMPQVCQPGPCQLVGRQGPPIDFARPRLGLDAKRARPTFPIWVKIDGFANTGGRREVAAGEGKRSEFSSGQKASTESVTDVRQGCGGRLAVWDKNVWAQKRAICEWLHEYPPLSKDILIWNDT